jgi:hypothetical protein
MIVVEPSDASAWDGLRTAEAYAKLVGAEGA